MGLVLISPEKLIIEKSLKLGFSATNNEAEYEALLEGMFMVQRMRGKSATMLSDSRLVVGQVKGELEARDERMQGYLAQIRHLQLKFESFSLQHIPRSGNTHIDFLATQATFSAHNLPRVILIEDLCKPSGIRGNMIGVHHVRIGPSWMDPIIQFLSKDVLPKDKSEAKRYVGKLLGSGYPRTRNCISSPSLGRTYSTFTLRHQSYSLRNYMKESMGAI